MLVLCSVTRRHVLRWPPRTVLSGQGFVVTWAMEIMVRFTSNFSTYRRLQL